MKYKKYKVIILSIFLILIFGMGNSFSTDSIMVIVNGNKVEFDVEPVVENGRTLVPVRAIFEALNATVNWDSSTKTISGIKNNRTIVLKVDSTNAYVNGENKVLDVPASIKNGRTLVPLRFISENLGTIVNWNSSTKTITINDSLKSTIPPTTIPGVSIAPTPTIYATIAPIYTTTNVIVYVTESGKKYHTIGCRYISESSNPISLDEAKQRGYEPCSVCHPPKQQEN